MRWIILLLFAWVLVWFSCEIVEPPRDLPQADSATIIGGYVDTSFVKIKP